YTVKETSTDGNGITVDTRTYTVKVNVSDNGDGTLSVTADNNATALNFKNTYKAAGEITFEGTKTIEGRALTANDAFTFEIKEGEDVIGTATNDASGKIAYPTIEYTLADVGEHIYTVKETSTNGNGIIVDGKTYTVTVTVSDNGDGTLKITADENAAALNFKNTYAANGEVVLRVTKQLTGRDLAEEEFSFQLKDAADNVLQTKTNDADGNVIFDSIAYEAGGEYKYTITEVKGESGGVTYDEHVVNVTVNVTDNGDGELTAEAVYEGETTFVNAYETEGSFELKGEKQLIGREFKEGDTFTFKLSGDENAKLPEVVEVTVTPDEGSSAAFAFATITIDETDLVDGAYTATYTIEEVAGNISGITYDENKHAVKVEAEDNGDGTITIDVKYEDGEKAILKNYYGAVGQWTLTANKTVDGEAATEDQVFDFGLYEQGILVGSIVKNEAGLITFPTVTYTEEDIGEHTYTVKELGFSGTVSDAFSYVCDETVYTVIVNVEDADGELDITWETSDGEKEITFRNTRLWKVALEKSDRNDSTIKLPGAVYTLYKDAACTDKYADITTGVGGVGFLMNVPAGTYWVKETKAPAGYEVDPEAYEVKVPNGEDISKPVFVPVSDYPMEGNLTLDVEKVMDGRAFQAGDTFTFTISALSGTPMPEKTMVTINPTSGNTAKVDFGKIEFTFEDVGKTYEYTVKETAGDIQGITYDTKFHTATVKVSEGANENIIAEVTYSDGEKMILTNTYTASNELKLDVEKAITGRAFMAGDSFTFTVEAAENVPMPEKTEVTIEPASGTAAKVDFGKISYSQADVGKTYTYTVKEEKGTISGITYDEKAYTVKVEITDNGDGTLTVTPTYEKGSSITFTNTYAASGAYQLKAVKHLDGKALEEGQFTFVLMNGDGKELETAKNGADGSIAFKAMTFNQNDVGKTYAYRIAERNEGVLGYIYDTTVYDVKLNILDNGDGTLTVKADGIPESGMVFENVFNELASFTVRKEWQGKEGPAITLTLYANGQKMDPQPQYVKSGNLYMYENLPVYDENDKAILYSVKEAFMDGYMTIYENSGEYAGITDQVMNGGKIINRSVTDFAVKKVWEGLTEGEEAPAITLTLYCNGQKVDKPTPTPDKNGWYHYYNLPATVNGEEAVYTVREEALDGFATTYLSGGVEVEEAGNGDTIVNRKIPKTGDESMIGLWSCMTVLSGAAFILLMKKRRTVD
ncbi:MAG: Cna B-type domain-containing protein, partial [Clostridia bacterium]|nr:Cna B-type domain-containing protein [Clostridia bacterium]